MSNEWPSIRVWDGGNVLPLLVAKEGIAKAQGVMERSIWHEEEWPWK